MWALPAGGPGQEAGWCPQEDDNMACRGDFVRQEESKGDPHGRRA